MAGTLSRSLPCDFFRWGFLKTRVYMSRPRNLQDLKTNIQEEIHNNKRKKSYCALYGE